MFSRIWSALKARRAAMLKAEALVYKFGSCGVEMAQTFSCDQSASKERSEHYRRVARIAERRYLGIKGLPLLPQPLPDLLIVLSRARRRTRSVARSGSRRP